MLENHHLPCRGQAGPSVQTFFAQEHENRVFCYANANLTRDEQAGQAMHFVEFWHALTGHDPKWLYFDSKLTTYAELSRLDERRLLRDDSPPRIESFEATRSATGAGLDRRRD